MQRGEQDTVPPPSGAQVPNFGGRLSVAAAFALAVPSIRERELAEEPSERDLTWLEEE
jgi:hypothetical protein